MLEAVWRDPIQTPSPDPLQCPAKMEHVRFGVRTRYFPLGLPGLFLGCHDSLEMSYIFSREATLIWAEGQL